MTRLCGIGGSTESSNLTKHNIQKGLVPGLVSRSVPSPTPAKWGARPHISPMRKPWQAPIHTSLHVNTPQAVTLNPGCLLTSQHRVVEVSVTVEDGVVVPQHPHQPTPMTED